jgi:hypothetical protein
MTSSDIG